MAGLLDLLSSGSGGGLLDFLRNNALNQQFSSGLPSDQAQYGQAQMAPPMQANAQMPIPQQPPPVIQAQPMQAPQPQPMQQAAQQPAQGPDFGDRLMAGFQGFAAPSAGGLFGHLAGGMAGLSGQGNLTAKALLAKGVDPQTVQAAISNPILMKTLIDQTYGQGQFTQETDKDGNVWNVNKLTGQKTVAYQPKDDKFQHVQTGEGFGGQRTYGTFNTKTGETKPDASATSGAPGMPSFGSLLAQGVQYDPNKSGDEYMAQFSPEVQAAAKAYIHGDVMPTGNARKDSIASAAKTIAQKWGQDKGIPVNDSTYTAKRTMANQLASSSNSALGGILANGESSFSHLAEATASMAGLGNASHDYPMGGAIAHAQNYIGNAAGGSDTKAKILATVDNLGKYGAESTKFYAGTGGGVEERTAARKDVDPNVVSGEEMAAFAEKEKSLMLDRLNTKFQDIRNIYGEDEGNAIIAKHMPQIQQNIATIDANVAKLRGISIKPAPTGAPDRSAIEAEMKKRGLMK